MGAEYVPYGEGVQIFDWLDGTVPPDQVPREAMFEGVAGCGKTRMLCEWVKAVCENFPASKGLLLRETRVSLNDSVLDVLENEVLGPNHPAVMGGATKEHRTFYRNKKLGGEIILGGMDNPTKLFSTQYDWIWFNEMQETTQEKWESLHRALRGSSASRGGENALPFRILLGDCNPEDEYHWANQRANEGDLHRIVGRFWDNPVFFDHKKKEWTDEGREYLERLGYNLTGVRRDRLYLGLWVSAEGQVWPNYRPPAHLVDGQLKKNEAGNWILDFESAEEKRKVELQWFVGGQDIGFNAPGCAQVWGFDEESRAYRVAEIYRSNWDQDEWARAWLDLCAEFKITRVLTDWDPGYIQKLNTRLHALKSRPIVQQWSKLRGPLQEKVGIDQVRVRMRKRPDGSYGFYLLKNCHRHYPDPVLVQRRQPLSFEQEIRAYVFMKPKQKQDLPPDKWDDPDPTCIDHGCDTARAVIGWADGKDFTPPAEKPTWPKGSYGEHWEKKLRRRWRAKRQKGPLDLPWKRPA